MPCASGAQAHCGAPCRVPGARDAPPAALRPPGAPGLGPLRPAGRSCWAHAGAGKAGSFRPAVAPDEVQLLLTTRYCVQLRPRLLLTLTFRGRGDARPHRQGPRDPRRLHVRPPSRRVPASRKRGRKAPGRIAPRKPPGATPTAAYTSLARTWDLAAGRQEARFASSQQVLVRSRGGMGVSRLCQMVWKLRWETRHRPRLPGPAGCLATRDHVGGHLQGGTRAASAAPALCLAPHLHVPTHQAALRRAGPPVVVKTLAGQTSGSVGGAGSCVRGHEHRE